MNYACNTLPINSVRMLCVPLLGLVAASVPWVLIGFVAHRHGPSEIGTLRLVVRTATAPLAFNTDGPRHTEQEEQKTDVRPVRHRYLSSSSASTMDALSSRISYATASYAAWRSASGMAAKVCPSRVVRTQSTMALAKAWIVMALTSFAR